MKIRKFREYLFPKGTLLERAFSVWRREGTLSLLTRGSKLVFQKLRQFVLFRFLSPAKEQQVFPAVGLSLPLPGKVDIICFPVINWDFRFQRPQQILTQFARHGHRVFYLHANFSGLNDSTVHFSVVSDRIYELTLPGDETLALYRDDLRDPTLSCSLHSLIGFLELNNISNALCLVYHPFWMPLVRQLKEQYGWKIIYDCIDDISGFEVAHDKIIALEKGLISDSDLVVTSSRYLYQRVYGLNSNCALIPNAADYDHFSRVPPRTESPLSQLQLPVIGYFGAISEWFDEYSVRYAALQHPEWSFVLIGDTWGGNIKRLKELPNVHFFGEKPYKDLPAYLAGFDVTLIPFLHTPLTKATNPVKVFEYLSAGKPVVAASLPELQELKDLVLLYSTPDEFIANVDFALGTDTQALSEKRRAFARENTWEKRYQAFKRSVDLLYLD